MGPHSCASGPELAQKPQESFCNCSNGVMCDAADASLPRVILSFMLGMIASPILIAVTAGESTGFHLRLLISLSSDQQLVFMTGYCKLCYFCRCILSAPFSSWRSRNQAWHQTRSPFKRELRMGIQIWSRSWTLLSRSLPG